MPNVTIRPTWRGAFPLLSYLSRCPQRTEKCPALKKKTIYRTKF